MSFLAISMQRSLQGSKVYMRLYFCHAKDHAFDSFSTRTYGVWRVTLPLRAYIYSPDGPHHTTAYTISTGCNMAHTSNIWSGNEEKQTNHTLERFQQALIFHVNVLKMVLRLSWRVAYS